MRVPFRPVWAVDQVAVVHGAHSRRWEIALMEQTNLPERITRIEENMATKDMLAAVEQDLKDQIVGVKSDLQKLDAKIDQRTQALSAKMDLGFSEVKRMIGENTKLIKHSTLEAENKLLKKIIRWGLALGLVVIPAIISLFARVMNVIAPSP